MGKLKLEAVGSQQSGRDDRSGKVRKVGEKLKLEVIEGQSTQDNGGGK